MTNRRWTMAVSFAIALLVGTWGAPRIYPEIAGILDNPEAAFGRLRELGSGLFGSSGQPNAPGGSLMQGIESLFGSKDRPSPAPRLGR